MRPGTGDDGLCTEKEGYRIQDSTAAAAMQPRFCRYRRDRSIYKKKDKVHASAQPDSSSGTGG